MSEKIKDVSLYYSVLREILLSVPFGTKRERSKLWTYASAIVAPDTAMELMLSRRKFLRKEISALEYNKVLEENKYGILELQASDLLTGLLLGLVYSSKGNRFPLESLFRPAGFLLGLFEKKGFLVTENGDLFMDVPKFSDFLMGLRSKEMPAEVEVHTGTERFIIVCRNVLKANGMEDADRFAHPVAFELLGDFLRKSDAEKSDICGFLLERIFGLRDCGVPQETGLFGALRTDAYFRFYMPLCVEFYRTEYEEYFPLFVDVLNEIKDSFMVGGKPLSSYLPEGYAFSTEDTDTLYPVLNHVMNNIFYRRVYWIDAVDRILHVDFLVDNLGFFKETAKVALYPFLFAITDKFSRDEDYESLSVSFMLDSDVANLENIAELSLSWASSLSYYFKYQKAASMTVRREFDGKDDGHISGTLCDVDLSRPLGADGQRFPLDKYKVGVCSNPHVFIHDAKRNEPRLYAVWPKAERVVERKETRSVSETGNEGNAESVPEKGNPVGDNGMETVDAVPVTGKAESPKLSYDRFFVDGIGMLLKDGEWSKIVSAVLDLAMPYAKSYIPKIKYKNIPLADYVKDIKYRDDDIDTLTIFNLLGNYVVSYRDMSEKDGRKTVLFKVKHVSDFWMFLGPMLLAYYVYALKGRFSDIVFGLDFDDGNGVSSHLVPWLSWFLFMPEVSVFDVLLDGKLVKRYDVGAKEGRTVDTVVAEEGYPDFGTVGKENRSE